MATNTVGLFDAPATALAAAGELKGAGFDATSVISPIPLHGAEKVLGEKKSVIKRFTFLALYLACCLGSVLRPVRPYSLCFPQEVDQSLQFHRS